MDRVTVCSLLVRASDEDLAQKFRANAADTIDDRKVEKAIDMIMNLENLENAAEMMEVLVR